MCCTLHEEPSMEDEGVFVRLAPISSVAEANESCLPLLEKGIRCRVVLEELARGMGGGFVPVIHVVDTDLQRARAILAREWRRPFAAHPV